MASSERSSAKLNSSRGQATYFPAIPPSTPKAALSYSRALYEAPRTALAGVIVDGRQPERHPVWMRHRVRTSVGLSNRWRLPESLGSDLLGSSQAVRAVRHKVNESMMNIISAENPLLSLNQDPTKPYKFKALDDVTPVEAPASNMADVEKVSVPKPTEEEPTHTKKRLSSSSKQSTPRSRNRHTDLFQYHAKTSALTAPDVLLQCLNLNWELHRPMLQKSETLAELLEAAENPGPKSYYKSPATETLDDYVTKSSFYNAHHQEAEPEETQEGSTPPGVENVDASRDVTDADQGGDSTLDHPKHISVKKTNNMTVIKLEKVDELVTPKAFAIALGNLYHEELQVPDLEVVGIMGAAHALRFPRLLEECATRMRENLGATRVCWYHTAAVKFGHDELQETCERWLELNLVPEMSKRVGLRDIPSALLQKVLQAIRLFTYNEFQLYKTLAFWTFLQLNPDVQVMPAYSTVLTYFNSLPKSSCLIEREEGQAYASLFMSLRLHGITDTNHMMDVQAMNIVPQAWIIKVLSQHYHALQGGGDMPLLTNFQTGAVRQGFIIHEEPHYHSEVFSLHGFHLELRGARQNSPGQYQFFMQRLKPSDPVLSFRHCERSTFSMRPERDVQYSIRVQWVDKEGNAQVKHSGVLNQRFGLGNKTSKSMVLTIENMKPPLYVSFALLFPPS